MKQRPIRIGILGCTAVAGYALLEPAMRNDNVDVTAVASRSLDRARSYAARNGIESSYGSYKALLASPNIDAVYIPLPSALHHTWAIAAMEAGLPVLCEKPLASNSSHAFEMLRVSERTGMPLIEAVHWLHHPLAHRIGDIVRSGAIGEVKSVDVWFKSPLSSLSPENIRRDYELGGGCFLDMGCYCVSLARMVVGSEPTGVESAEATLLSPRVDGAMSAKLRFPSGVLATIRTSMCEPEGSLDLGAHIVGEYGELLIDNPFLPSFFQSKITLAIGGKSSVEYPLQTSSYDFQLRVVERFIRREIPAPVPLRESVANMKVLDSVYIACGLGLRP